MLGKTVLFTTPKFGLSVLDRYLTIELVLPFVFGVCAFSSIGLAVGSLFDIVKKVSEAGLSMNVALQVLLLKMPEFVVYSFPMSTLLATMMGYGRLTSDSELIALRSVGISVYRLVVPAILLSIAVTGFTFLFNEKIVPSANYQSAMILEQALGNENPNFSERNIFYPEYKEEPVTEREDDEEPETQSVLNRLFYAEEFNGKKMQGLTILDRSQDGINQIVTAESAAWNFKENIWDFYNGTIYIIAPDGSYRNILRFEHQKIQLPKAPLDLAQAGRKSNEMNILELRDYIKILEQGNDETKVRKLKVKLQQKLAIPFVCIIFALVGAALGTKPNSASKATSFGISIAIIFSYYVMSYITMALGVVEVLDPFTAAWLPNFFGLAAGAILLTQSAK